MKIKKAKCWCLQACVRERFKNYFSHGIAWDDIIAYILHMKEVSYTAEECCGESLHSDNAIKSQLNRNGLFFPATHSRISRPCKPLKLAKLRLFESLATITYQQKARRCGNRYKPSIRRRSGRMTDLRDCVSCPVEKPFPWKFGWLRGSFSMTGFIASGRVVRNIDTLIKDEFQSRKGKEIKVCGAYIRMAARVSRGYCA